MEPNKVPNNLPNDMDVVVVIDKDKLPEDVRKMIEEKLPKDIQDKVFEMLQNGKMGNIIPLQRDKGDKVDKDISKDNDIPKDNKLFAIQTGEVVGNIYKDNIYKKEEEKEEPITKKKKDEIKEGLDGCC